jgi:predicted small metal-binding protein
MMGNYQQELMDIMVKQILSKHQVKPASDLSNDDKEKVKNVVGKLQAEVEKFLENQNKTLSEKDFVNSNPQVETENQIQTNPVKVNPVVKESLKKIMKGSNDLKKVKMFINNLNK